jgi:hypothetical protein
VLPRTRFSEARRKDECCRRLLEIQLRVLGEEVRELIGGFVALPGRRRRLGADFEELLRRVLERSAREAEGAGIPALLAERFREWHLPRIRGAAETAREVLRSGVYPTPETELCALLDLLFFVFRTAVSDAAATLGSLNGELDALLERAEGPRPEGRGSRDERDERNERGEEGGGRGRRAGERALPPPGVRVAPAAGASGSPRS